MRNKVVILRGGKLVEMLGASRRLRTLPLSFIASGMAGLTPLKNENMRLLTRIYLADASISSVAFASRAPRRFQEWPLCTSSCKFPRLLPWPERQGYHKYSAHFYRLTVAVSMYIICVPSVLFITSSGAHLGPTQKRNHNQSEQQLAL